MTKIKVKIGEVVLGDKPRIVLPVSDCDVKNIPYAKVNGVDIIEARIDLFKKTNSDYVIKILNEFKKYKLPIIATIRIEQEGGSSVLSDNERFYLFKEILQFVDAIDVELASKIILAKTIKIAKNYKKTVIISYHNFKLTPSNTYLGGLIGKAKRLGADIVKLACLAQNKDDLKRMAQITLNSHNKNIVTISLGDKGKVSRVFFPFIGSLMTYTCLSKSFAPGQIPLEALHEFLQRFCPLHCQKNQV